MEIINVDSMDQMTDSNVFYEMNGKFYGICWECRKVFKIENRTVRDIRNNTEPGDEDCFCSADCCDKFFKN